MNRCSFLMPFALYLFVEMQWLSLYNIMNLYICIEKERP